MDSPFTNVGFIKRVIINAKKSAVIIIFIHSTISSLIVSFIHKFSFIVILSLFNCCNTIVTSINSRSREFALFRGIGISKHEINKIVKLESYIYIIVSFCISIIPILIVRSIIIKPFESINLINWKFIGAIILIVFILVSIIMITTLKKLNKIQN
ncbi:FtsX-like permease family protein, partial [Clostridioides difficile]|uniref:FtsX-like permease family protein n=1 Tax=Clostridioides difficile TaxID=1496 RepID=UPI0027DDACEA